MTETKSAGNSTPSISNQFVDINKTVTPQVTNESKPVVASSSGKLWAFNDVMACCQKFIGEREGLKLNAYLCSAGVWTVGYGHAIMINGSQATSKTHTFAQLPIEFQNISKPKADAIFEQDILRFLTPVVKEIGSICNGNQITALTSFAFNLGIKNFMDSTLLKVIKENPQNFVEIRKQFNRWIYAGETVLKGLQTRRKLEADLYEKA